MGPVVLSGRPTASKSTEPSRRPGDVQCSERASASSTVTNGGPPLTRSCSVCVWSASPVLVAVRDVRETRFFPLAGIQSIAVSLKPAAMPRRGSATVVVVSVSCGAPTGAGSFEMRRSPGVSTLSASVPSANVLCVVRLPLASTSLCRVLVAPASSVSVTV